MATFILNQTQQRNGDHEVHNKTVGCTYMPARENQIELGEHATCHGAVLSAKQRWPGSRINGCYYCCNPCHTT